MKASVTRWLATLVVVLVMVLTACSSSEPAVTVDDQDAQGDGQDAQGDGQDAQGDSALPEGDLSFSVGHPSSISFYDLPTVITHDRLNAEGWDIEEVAFTRTDLAAQAIVQGSVQLEVSQYLDLLRAIEQGGDTHWLMENNGGEFVMIAGNDIQDCADLEGQRFAIHAETSSSSLMAKNWLIDDCGIDLQTLVIPGGENRVVALRNGEVEGTLTQLADWLNLDAEKPGDYHVLDTGDLFDITGASYFGNSEWIEENHDVVVAYLAATLETFRMIHEDPSIFEEAVREHLPETPPEIIPAVTDAYLETVQAWPQNGGDNAVLAQAAEVYAEQGELQPGMDVEEHTDTSFLEAALEQVGRVEDAR